MQSKSIELEKQDVIFKDLGMIRYKAAWDYQELLLMHNVQIKSALLNQERSKKNNKPQATLSEQPVSNSSTDTSNYFILCEHPPVYTIGKSGNMQNILISEEAMQQKGIEFFKTNRGGDITFHGPGQIVGYPILDLEKFYTDIGRYLRELEEVIILSLGEYGIIGQRSKGETGVWIEPGIKGSERKICAMGVRCSRWVTMHGFALNVNTDISYFDNIIPCGIENKEVTSLQKELKREVDLQEAKEKIQRNFENVFNTQLVIKNQSTDMKSVGSILSANL